MSEELEYEGLDDTQWFEDDAPESEDLGLVLDSLAQIQIIRELLDFLMLGTVNKKIKRSIKNALGVCTDLEVELDYLYDELVDLAEEASLQEKNENEISSED